MIQPLHKILVIDDDHTCRFITEFLLNDFGVTREVRSLENAVEGIKHFRFHENDLPDLVLLDINMPMMDAWEFLDWVNENGFAGRTRFVIYSTLVRPKDVDRSKAYPDVIGFIEKPPSKEELERIIQMLEPRTPRRIAI